MKPKVDSGVFRDEKGKAYFLPEQRDNLNSLSDKIDDAFVEMVSNLNTPSYDNVDKTKARALEHEINIFRNKLRNDHLSNLGKPNYNVKSGMIYNNIFNALEKVGDHIINVLKP